MCEKLVLFFNKLEKTLFESHRAIYLESLEENKKVILLDKEPLETLLDIQPKLVITTTPTSAVLVFKNVSENGLEQEIEEIHIIPKIEETLEKIVKEIEERKPTKQEAKQIIEKHVKLSKVELNFLKRHIVFYGEVPEEVYKLVSQIATATKVIPDKIEEGLLKVFGEPEEEEKLEIYVGDKVTVIRLSEETHVVNMKLSLPVIGEVKYYFEHYHLKHVNKMFEERVYHISRYIERRMRKYNLTKYSYPLIGLKLYI